MDFTTTRVSVPVSSTAVKHTHYPEYFATNANESCSTYADKTQDYILTPNSLPQSSRTASNKTPTHQTKRVPFQHLYMGELLPSIQTGHFCGAICLAWLNPWKSVKAKLSDPNSNSPYMGLTSHFMKYTKHIIEKAQLSPVVLLVALIYIYRLRETSATPLFGSPTSEARIFIVAIMTANKYVDDVSYTTSTWAKMTDMDAKELSKMELEFLKNINFNLHIGKPHWIAFNSFLRTTVFSLVDNLTHF